MKTKEVEFRRVKAGPEDGLEEGQFWAYASVFGNKDSYGDVVEKGAFTQTLKDWALKGAPIPLLFGHNNTDPDYFVGKVLEASEDDVGLKVLCQLDLESAKGAQVYRLVKAGLLAQMSFMYEVQDGERITPVVDGKSAWDESYYSLKELKLYEVSVVHIGANQETSILDVKTASDPRVKAGKALSAKTESALRSAVEKFETGLASLKAVLPEPDEPDEDEPDEPEGDEGKSDDEAKASVAAVSKAAALVQLMNMRGIA